MTIEQILKDMWDEGIRNPLMAQSDLRLAIVSYLRQGVDVTGRVPSVDEIAEIFGGFYRG